MSAAHPDAWAEDKRAKVGRYVSGEVASTLTRVVPVLAPGSPVAAWIGAACNGGRNENTTGWVTCTDSERAQALRHGKKPLGGDPLEGYGRVNAEHLHELGPLGVEGGHVPELVGGRGSAWYIGARSAIVAAALGRPQLTDDRPGVTAPGRWYGAVEEQLAIGVWNNALRHGRAIFAKLPLSLRPELDVTGLPRVWTLWCFVLATMAWSAGDGGAAAHVQRYAGVLAAVPEALRWGALVGAASTYQGDGEGHERPSYSVLRTCQKLAAARLAADELHDDAALRWLDDALGADRARILAQLVTSAASND